MFCFLFFEGECGFLPLGVEIHEGEGDHTGKDDADGVDKKKKEGAADEVPV